MIDFVQNDNYKLSWVVAVALAMGAGYLAGRNDAPQYIYEMGYHDGLTRAVEIMEGDG